MAEHEESPRDRSTGEKNRSDAREKIVEILMKIRSISFENWLSISILLGAFFLLLTISYHITPVFLRYDGSYNLQVVDLLAQGEGYASYGALRGGGKWLFDPHVTTGPAVLVPLSFVWYMTGESVLAAHLTILFTLWLYAAGLFFLFRNWSTESTLLPFALAVGLSSLCVGIRVDEVLGEIPGLAAVVWAAWAVRRNKPVVAAVLAGFAVQMKVLFLLPGISLLLIYAVWDFMSNDRIRFMKIFTCCLVFISPTLLFELYRFISVGSVENYLHSVEELLAFTARFSVGQWFASDVIGKKISVIYESLPDPAWMACGLTLLVGLLSFVFHIGPEKIRYENQSTSGEELIRMSLVGLMVAGLVVFVMWVTQIRISNHRLSTVVLLLFLPAFMAVCGYYHIRLLRFFDGRKSARVCLRTLITLCAASLIVAFVERAVDIYRENSHRVELSAEQKRVSDLILAETSTSLYVDGWHQNPDHLLLTGNQGVPAKTGENQIMVIQKYQTVDLQKSFEEYKDECDDVLYFSTLTLVCRLPDDRSEDDRLHVVDWGPRNTRAGVVPNKQLGGYMGMWVRVDKVDRRQFGPVKISFSGYPSVHGHFSTGEVVTGAFPPRRIREPGEYEVTLEQTATGRVFHVGYFVVE